MTYKTILMVEERTKVKITVDQIQIEVINEDYDVTRFRSYENDLAKFLVEDALDNQKQFLSLTFLWFFEGRLVSYITILNDKINLKGDLKDFFKQKGIHYGSLPALKIGRLCVDDRFVRRGLGKLMIQSAISIANKLNTSWSGCRFITLDAKRNDNPSKDPLNFYKKQGFKVLKEKNGSTTPMFLDLKLI